MKYTQEQAAIIHAPADENLLVIAGAGSGKTMTMTSRIVSLINEEHVSPEAILGLTFTKKAASELLSRVGSAVSSAGDSGQQDPDRLFLKPEIHTYDAFFQAIVRQYGLFVGMSQDTQPLSEAGAYQLAANVVKDHLDSIFSGRSAQELEAIEAEEEGEDEGMAGAFSTVVKQILALSRACADSMISQQCTTFEDALERIRDWDQAFIEQIGRLTAGDRIPDQPPTDSNISIPKKPGKSSKQTYADKLGAMRQARHDYRLFQADSLRQLAAQRERLLTLVQYYQEAKRSAGMAEYSDFTLAAFQLVTRFPNIGETYRRRFTHVFLDEYQDTSTTQALLLAALFHPQTGQEARQETNTTGSAHCQQSWVTAVGDPFQSIYAWRGASPGAFATFQEQFGMTSQQTQPVLTLSQTYRNDSVILQAANCLTQPLRQDPSPQAAHSSALVKEVEVGELTTRPGAGLGSLGLLGYADLGQEVDGVVRFAKAAQANYGNKDEAGFDKDAPHVAVLFRSKKSMPVYQKALEEAGLSVQVVGYSALFDRPEILDLLALLRLLCDHTDSQSLLRLLAAPRFNLTAADLQAFAALADQLNQESQYRALVQAGLVEDGLRGAALGKAVRANRDRLSASIYLVDVLLEDDLATLLASKQAQGISQRGKNLLMKAAQVLIQAQAQANAPVRQAVLAAARALGLDIDLVVASSIANPTGPIDASYSQAGLEAFLREVDAYTQELPQGLSPSLAGFVSWIDTDRESPQEPNTGTDTQADVVLMSIHQAKGLEWDAVAVVGLAKEKFPSSQGDSLQVEALQDWDPGSLPMDYRSLSHTWLQDPTAVPVPVRADSQILPRFPHDSQPEQDPLQSLQSLSLTSLEDEAIGKLRNKTGFVYEDSLSFDDQSMQEPTLSEQAIPAYLTQPEEYGARLHKDERRLAYVALTRARYDLLITFSSNPSNLNRALLLPEGQEADAKDEDPQAAILKAASNFWRELYCNDCRQAQKVRAGAAWLERADPNSEARRLLPVGFFLGQRAQAYEAAVVSQALQEAPQLDQAVSSQPEALWPVQLSSQISQALSDSARRVAQVDQQEAQLFSKQEDSLYSHAVRVLKLTTGRLGVQSNLLLSQTQLLKEVGSRLLQEGTQSVTSIQARSGSMDADSEVAYWRNVVRPVPHVVSPSAQAGTLFHAWAADFLLPDYCRPSGRADLDSTGNDLGSVDSVPTAIAGLGAGQLAQRQQLLADLAAAELDQTLAQEQRQILVWERRLADSQWAGRQPVWVERPIVALVAGQVVKGTLDAVFAGGLDPKDSRKLYTIVDWKTGRKPLGQSQVALKLQQLDLYRLLLSRLENIELDSIDACLYYVSEVDPQQRLIEAEPKGQSAIEDQLRMSLPQQSDND